MTLRVMVVVQDRVVSGVGNWVADEVCFQAHVHPGATCNTLAPEQVRRGVTNRVKLWCFSREWEFSSTLRRNGVACTDRTLCAYGTQAPLYSVAGAGLIAYLRAVYILILRKTSDLSRSPIHLLVHANDITVYAVSCRVLFSFGSFAGGCASHEALVGVPRGMRGTGGLHRVP